LIEASIPDFKAPDLKPLIDYLRTQVKKLKINVVKEEATAKSIENGKFDAVIVAAGAAPLALEDVRGITHPKVTSASQVLHGEAKLGQKIAVIGGGIVGTEVGLFLAEQGKEVVFIEMLDTFMNNITFDEKLVYEERFKNLIVSIHTGKRLEGVSDQGATVVDRYGVRTTISADTVVLAAGFRPNRDLIDRLRKIPNLHVFEAGDCIRPRKIFDAIHEGHLAAKLLT
jgi:2-enoate reductase